MTMNNHRTQISEFIFIHQAGEHEQAHVTQIQKRNIAYFEKTFSCSRENIQVEQLCSNTATVLHKICHSMRQVQITLK